MAAEQLITACVFHPTAAQRETANRLLQESGATPLSSGGDVTYAQLSGETLAKLRTAGLELEPVVSSVTPSEPPTAPPPEQIQTPASTAPPFPARRTKRTDPALRGRAARLAQRVTAVTAGRQCYRVALAGPLTGKIQEQLKGLGIKLVNFRRGYYQAFLEPGSLEKLKQLEGVREVRPYDLLDTVTTDLLVRLEEHDSERQQVQSVAPQPSPGPTANPQMFDVIMHEAADLPAVLDRLQHLREVHIIEKSDEIIRFSMPLDEELLARVASWPEVRSLGPYRAPTLFSDLMRRSLGVESVGIVPPAGGAPKPWTGLGEVIAILDSGIDLTHPDFGPAPGAPGSRIRALVSFQGCDTDDLVGHGTHVAGIASGSGAASNNQIRGVAPAAELVIVGMVNDDGNGQRTLALPLEMEDLFREATSRGAKIINCSWARKVNSAYDTVALKIDEFAWRNPETLIVVAAGNEGAFSTGGERRYYTLGSPASAKNVLTVGACGSERAKLPNGYANTWAGYNARFTGEQGKRPLCPALDEPAALTSCGPTDGLGIKPTLLAPGTFILAPRARHIDGSIAYLDFPDHGSRYVFMHGTSMAAPGVSGAAAILRQFLREEMQTSKPSSALLRALLVSATQPVSRMTWAKAPDVGHPDFDQGFGRLDLTLLLPNSNASAARRILFDDVANDSPDALASDVAPGDPRKIFRKYEVDVNPPGTQALVFALAWTDPPGSSVMNDLQLAVQMPDGRWHYGNEDHKPPDAALLPAPDPAFPELVVSDRHNTIEKITISNPAAARYAIRIWARNTAEGPQGYSLVVVGDGVGELKRVV